MVRARRSGGSAPATSPSEKSPVDAAPEEGVTLVGLARRVPKPGRGKDAAEGHELALRYDSFCKIIMWLEAHPERIIQTWATITSPIASGNREPEGSAGEWNSEYRNVWRLPNYWCASFLSKRRPEVFDKPLIEAIHKADDTAIRKLFKMEVALDGRDPLPPECLRKDVCSRVMIARAEQVGSRLKALKTTDFPANGQLDWHKIGRYQMTFGDDGKLVKLVHKSGAEAKVPPLITITNQFVLRDNFSDLDARVEYKVDNNQIEYYLHTFFPGKDCGPHEFLLGSKGKAIRDLATDVKKKMDAELQASMEQVVQADVSLLDATEQEERKRLLNVAREKVQAAKKAKDEKEATPLK